MNNVHDNGGLGIAVDGIDSSLGVISVQQNTILDNTGGDGLRVNLISTDGSHVVDRVLTSFNTIERNAGDGIVQTKANLTPLMVARVIKMGKATEKYEALFEELQHKRK